MWFVTLKIYYRLKFYVRKLTPARLLFIVILGLSLQQLGQGSYIYAKAFVAQYLIEQAWHKTLEGEQQVKPWSWADTWPVAKLSSKKYNAELYVLAGDNGRTLAFGPGYRFGTELPGAIGNSIISGHRDTHFSFLRDVVISDQLSIQTQTGELMQYRVTNTEVVSIDDDFIVIDDSSSPDIPAKLVLVTCYPFDAILPGGKLRYIVTAERVINHRFVSR